MARDLDVTDSVRTSKNPEEVMTLLRDASSWAGWQPEILRTEGSRSLARGDVVVGWARMLGFRVEGESTVLEAEKGTFEEDAVVGVRMKVRFEVVEDGDGTKVSRRIQADMPGGVLGRALAVLLKRRLRKMNVEVLEMLAR